MTYSIRKQNFIDYLDHNMFSHAYLFEVGNYEEDYSFILDFVKMLFCNNNNKFNKLDCDKCNICSLINQEMFPDLYIIRPDGNEIKKEQLLNLEKEFSNTSIVSNYKICIILEAEKMNISAANSILKFIEEPEDNIFNILVTKNKYKLLPTIVSRCLYFNIRDNEKYNFEDDYYVTFISYLKDNDQLFLNYDSIIDYFYEKDEESEEKKTNKTFNKKKIFCFFNNLNLYLFDYYNGDLKENIDINKNKIIDYISIIQKSLFELEYNINYKLWFDDLFCKLIGGNYD